MSSLREVLASGLATMPRPLYPGAVALTVRDGIVANPVVVGDAVRYADSAGTLLPEAERVPMRADTLFDVASLTKLFTATVLMTLVEEGRLGLDDPIAAHLPSFGGGRRGKVTLRHLLAHTSGLPALLQLWTDWPDAAGRKEAVLRATLKTMPGDAFEYSCIGYMVAGFLAEQVTGQPLPVLVRDRICRPLGLVDTGFCPSGDLQARAAATEYQPYVDRGMVRGTVHDENAWSLGGTAGNAGIFSTAADLARFGEVIRRGGELDGTRILRESTVDEMLRDQLPSGIDPGFRQGLGFRIAAPAFMGDLAESGAVGHTGFTGTSIVIDRSRCLVVVLLTNRVHPSRDWSDIAAVRRQAAEVAASEGPDGRMVAPPAASGHQDGGRGVLVRIRAALPTLRPAERRVALAVLGDPAGVAERAISALADECGTSAATVLRFCHAVGYRHYPDLRIALAREVSREEAGSAAGAHVTGDISPSDSLEEIVAKITYSDARAIEDTAATLDLDALRLAVDAVADARRIDIFGIGASGFVGQDLCQKLQRIGLMAFAWLDPHAALTSAALLEPGDVAVAISHTGTTIDTIDALRVAAERGASTIAITNFDQSPLTGYAKHVLTTAARETTFRSGATASRIAQLAVIDCLFVGVAQHSYDRTMSALERTYAVVQSRRVPTREPRQRRLSTGAR